MLSLSQMLIMAFEELRCPQLSCIFNNLVENVTTKLISKYYNHNPLGTLLSVPNWCGAGCARASTRGTAYTSALVYPLGSAFSVSFL